MGGSESGSVRDLVELFARIPGTRIRFSLMPAATSRLVDVRTSKVADRIAALDDFVDAGYEVHLKLLERSQSGQWNVRYKSPWKSRWVDQLLGLVDQTLPDCRIRYAF